ncbi:hypothetical protein NDU88_008472 [Pleurodeles waltl]|uniref:Uncharacterized protein n=1 Tax=Pleurodeles waltl TaxID=8319 RepID=A0AAV7N6S9_PLEWA|nr:hypothetical protein NDU88_008472 [Pleurodeles waltl]
MERCPGGTYQSVVLLQRHERKPEDSARGVIEECGMKEDADEEKEEDGYTEAAEGTLATRKDKEENVEGRARTEAQEGDSDQVLRWNPTTCHVPGGTWMEQIYHINLLKKWAEGDIPNLTVDSVLLENNLKPLEITLCPQQEDLHEAIPDISPGLPVEKKTKLLKVVRQYSKVFSTTPVKTPLIQHNIVTKEGRIVRLKPY